MEEFIRQYAEPVLRYALYQSPWALTAIVFIGIFLKFLPFRYPKAFESDGPKKFVTFLGRVIIFLFAINLGFFCGNNGWCRDLPQQNNSSTHSHR